MVTLGYKYLCPWHSKSSHAGQELRAFWKKARRAGKRRLHPEEQSSVAKGRRRRRRRIRRGGTRDYKSADPYGDPAEYEHFYAEDVSTHSSMVSTQQHRFKDKINKNVETVSTHVKSVSTRVAVFQKSSLPRSTHSRAGRHGISFQNSLSHIWDSVSTLPPGQVDTLRKLFILKVDGCHVSS
ncbi:hypothetical protein Taro_047799 [Colocasia esculenta]|uniref:Uncharacterized protein n=1 Tax=Colocasia esculenta TaxID=4460 RepID=A0A843X6Z4_COLES|nr:hypothetical protein [Colocasia esculenta]